MSRSSPIRNRIARIADSLSHFRQASPGSQRKSEMNNLSSKADQLEDRIADFLESNNKKISSLKEQVLKTQKLVEEEANNREIVLENSYKELEKLEAKFAYLIEQEMIARKESERKIMGLIEDRYHTLREELAKETNTRVSNVEMINQTLESDLPKLSDAIRNEINAREDGDKILSKKTSEEISRLTEALQVEKKIREDSEHAILEMLKDVVSKVKSELEIEKKIREETEENLLNLLEDTCNKLNAATQV